MDTARSIDETFAQGILRSYRATGLRLTPRDTSQAARAVALSITAVTLFILLLDGVIFRNALSPAYVARFTEPLVPRILEMSILAAAEETAFRLLLMTALVLALTAWRGATTPGVFIFAILAAQAVNAAAAFGGYPLYASLRYLAVGTLWGYLYWKHGWASALIGHSATHLVLDPLLRLTLLHT